MNKKEKKKQAELWKTAAWDMLYLVQCSINGLVPEPDRVEKMDLAKVYARSKSQSLEAMTYMALERLMEVEPSVKLSDEMQVLTKWEKAKNKAIGKTMLMDAARAKLFSYLEEKGIWHVALKGAVLCHMYPEYGMRQMSDNDILFDPAFRQEVHDWFVEQGYEVKSFGKSNHDEYQKKPVYNFEMHTALFKGSEQTQFAQYYFNIKDKLLLVPDKEYEYCMTDEDFYLYILAHAYKHYFNGGTGLRSLLDLYICNRVKNSMDRSYLDAELNKIGLLEFANEMRDLALKAFDSNAERILLSENERIRLKEFLVSCTYGTMKERWRRQVWRMQPGVDKVSAVVKLQYLTQRLFPDKTYLENWCQEYEPYITQHRWLMPIAPIWRIVKRGIENRKQVKEEFNTITRV